jgi:hypothetical protein
MRVERLSTLRSGRLYAQGDKPGTHLHHRLIQPRDKSKKNPNDPVGNRTRALRLVAQTLNQPRTPLVGEKYRKIVQLKTDKRMTK